jgi:Sulfotransferase family
MSAQVPGLLAVFPFVVGEARSGTTLLRLMLDSHPDLAVPPEAYFVTGLSKQRQRYERNATVDLPRLLDDLTGLDTFADWKRDVPQDVLRDAFSAPARGSYADAIRLLFHTYAGAHDKPRYGDKTPGNVTRMSLLAGLFPEARFVHLIRDVRSVALSLAEMPEGWGSSSVPAGAARWRSRIMRGRATGEALGNARYREVRYEDLVADPERTLRGILEFLEVPWNDAVLRHADRADHRVGDGRHDIHRNVAKPPTVTRVWRDQISSHDLEVVEAIAGEVMDELGYERAISHPSPEARATAREVWAAWEAHLDRSRRKSRVRRRLRFLRPGRSQAAKRPERTS